MRLDFHTHGKLAKKLPFSTAYTDWLFGEARRAGLDALCLTEHFNTLQFADVYGYIASVSRRTGDALELENGLRWSWRTACASSPAWRRMWRRAVISCPSGPWRPFWS